MDKNPQLDRLPQPMGHRPAPPGSAGYRPTSSVAAPLATSGGLKPGSVESDIASIDRQDKIERLRTIEDDYEHYDDDKPKKKKKKHRLLRLFGWLFLVLLLTGGGAAAGWYFWLEKEPRNMAAGNGQTTPTPPPAAIEEEAEPVSTHSSQAFNLSFDHPESWKAAETGDNKVTATSPVTQLKTAAGQTQAGQIVLTIQHKQSTLPEFTKGNALAVRESDKIAYAKPSPAQRANTYISYLNYAASAVKGIDGIYVTGDNGYQQNQYVPLTDVAKADPLITVTFRKCPDSKCAAPAEPVALATTAWDDVKFSKPIKTMLQSIIAQ